MLNYPSHASSLWKSIYFHASLCDDSQCVIPSVLFCSHVDNCVMPSIIIQYISSDESRAIQPLLASTKHTNKTIYAKFPKDYIDSREVSIRSIISVKFILVFRFLSFPSFSITIMLHALLDRNLSMRSIRTLYTSSPKCLLGLVHHYQCHFTAPESHLVSPNSCSTHPRNKPTAPLLSTSQKQNHNTCLIATALPREKRSLAGVISSHCYFTSVNNVIST